MRLYMDKNKIWQFVKDKNEKTKNKRFLGLNRLQVFIVLALVAMLFFFSDSSVFKRMKYSAQIKDLNKQIEFYRGQTEIDKVKLNELKTDKKNLEKFARENYFMKKDNEDVFVIE